ncbi:MAG TPA: hypothetical protein VFE14_09550, partial [Micromonosporaceae bacterium]|nr:hypothetical protein [Micromonosporaceae bacterium]
MGVTRTSTVLIAAASLLLGSGGAAPARSTPSPVARTGEESASTRAARTGMPVELVGERAETRSVFANPDGSFSVEQHARPIRVRRDGGWVPVDATLRGSPDGSLSPVATRLGLRLSGGGAGPLVTLSDGDRSVSLFWPGPLPAPVVDGPTATYLEVIPGVDLAVTADVEGFTQVLVVKNRQAAHDPKLALVRFGTVTRGVALSTDPDGTLRAADPRGDVVFRGPAPTMWDSGGHGGDAASRLVAPARGARQAVLRTEVGRGDLTVAPDMSMVDDPKTRFPVY